MTDKEILSKDEVDALLENVDEGIDQSQDKATQHSATVKSIDFSSQERIVRSQFPVLERIHERFSRKLAGSIYDLMSREVEITMEEMGFFKFSDYMCSLPTPTGINIVRMNPLRGKALVIFSADLIFSLVENYFGGSGRSGYKVEERDLTPAESRLMDIVMELVISDLADAWTPILILKHERVGSEVNPQLVNTSNSSDMMLVSPFKWEFQDNSGELVLVIPYSMLEPVREQLELGSSRSDDDIDPNWIESLKEELLDVDVNLNSTLVEKKITLREVLNLKSGEIIPVELPETITLDVEMLPRYRAKYGISRNKCALKILELLEI